MTASMTDGAASGAASGAPVGTEPTSVPVETLTDEELEVLAGPGGLVVRPFAAGFGSDEREVALRTAYRGLVARGIVEPPTPQARVDAVGEPGVELQVRRDVLSVVTLRAAARHVVAVARTTATYQDFWYAHVVDDVVLLEQVGADGLHRFALTTPDELPRLLVEAALHPDTGDQDGEPVPLDEDSGAPPTAIAERLGAALLRSDVVVRVPDDEHPVLLGLFTGPGAGWLVEARAGSDAPLVADPVRRADLEARLHREAARLLVGRQG